MTVDLRIRSAVEFKKIRATYRQVIAGVHTSYSITNVVELNGLHCGRLTVSMTVNVTLAHYDTSQAQVPVTGQDYY